jgi:hypothetical protein
VLVLALVALAGQAEWRGASTPEVEARAALVRRLGLTDVCVFTDARYTRHLSQADRFSAFQDHPFALEHFPSGSLVTSPPALREAP